ncbi:hypothetical protein D9M68_829500 [compost metagenome]
MSLQQLEQLHQGSGGVDVALLVAAEGIRAAAEQVGGLLLRELELLTHCLDQFRIAVPGVDLLTRQVHGQHYPLRFGRAGEGFATGRAPIRLHGGDDDGFALVGVGHVAGIVDQVSLAAYGASHGHSSLKDTMSRSSTSVNLR